MTETKTCPKCGSLLPLNSPEGICPACLMLAGLESRPAGGTDSEPNPTTLSSGFVPPKPEDLSKHFPQLEILEFLGKGGMGAVYKARQPGLDRLVAVKILPPEIGADPAFAERFTREARALAKLSHQNIVSVFDFGIADGQYYFIMEYVDGTNLRQLIASGGLKPEEALAIVPQICEALQFAHNEGIVHRDIKPENILIDKQGRVKIADFGLAKLLDKAQADVTLTAAHQVMGTLHYMAPEQMRGAGSVDHRADIFSLGVVFYEMLTGQLPIGKFEPPSKKVQIDVRLDDVVLRALESQPEKRYQRASELKQDTERVSSSRHVRPVEAEVSPQEPGDQVEAAARRLRKPMAALFIVGLAQLLVAAALVTWLGMTVGRIHATPATPQTTGEIDDTGNGATITVKPHKWRPYLGVFHLALVAAAGSMFIGVLAMAAAVFGSRLQLEGFVRVMCGLFCIPSPVWPFALPTALVAFSVLGRPNVRKAFAVALEEDEAEPRPSVLSNWSVWTTLCFAAAILALVSALVPWVWISIFGFAIIGLGIEQWQGIVVCVASGLAAVFVAAFSVMGNSRVGQGLSALVAGMVIAAVSGSFVWETSHPEPPQTTTTIVSGDESMKELGEEMSDSFAELFIGGINSGASFGCYAAIVCGALLALVGAGRLMVRPRLDAAVEHSSEETRNLKDDLESRPRFSRKAVVGFCWAPLFFLLLASLTITYDVTAPPMEQDRVAVRSQSIDGSVEPVSSEEPVRVNDVPRDSGPAWWQWVLIFTVLPLGLSAPVGTTILGLLAISDIRHSKGRLTGLPLAVTDSLLYPLLLLDGLILGVFWFLCTVGYEIFGPGTPMSVRAEWLCIAVTLLLSIPVCAYLDYRIVRAVWHKSCEEPGV